MPSARVPAPYPNHLKGRKVTKDDALAYVTKVKASTSAGVYNKFLALMKDYKAERADTKDVIDRAAELFAGQPQLIRGFSCFLPSGYKISANGKLLSQPDVEGLDQAYVMRVKKRFATRPQQYLRFLDVFKKYQQKLIPSSAIHAQVSIVTRIAISIDHRD